MPTYFTPLSAAVGGLLIGLSVGLLYLGIGRVTGISTVLHAAVAERGERGWRIAFLLALLAGAALWTWSLPDARWQPLERHWPWLIGSGLLVGAGTRLANGCTSGHGICGLARLSRRSLVATGVFMATAMVTVALLRHAGGLR